MTATSGDVAASEILVIGAGWAGLAAAVSLSSQGQRVRVVEAAAVPGGRARTLMIEDTPTDNGQHLLLGAYSAVRELLRIVGVDERRVLDRRSLNLTLHDGRHVMRFRAAPLPAPWHVAIGLLSASGISWSEKWRAISGIRRWQHANFTVADSVTVAQWLRDQPPAVVRYLWEPLCVAALTTPIERASAAAFARVLRDAFTRSRSEADLLFPARPLGEVLPDPAVQFIRSRGGAVQFQTRIKRLIIDQGRICGVATDEGMIAARAVILAVPPDACADLLDGAPACGVLVDGLRQFDYESIATVYAQFDESVRLPQPLTGLVGTLTHWVFDHGYWGRPGLLALVNSGKGPHVTWPKQQLIDAMLGELRALIPDAPAPREVTLLREKRAAFSCVPGIAAIRPTPSTPVSGLFLAGDFTATDYPSTLEGAVRSGFAAAREVMQPARG